MRARDVRAITFCAVTITGLFVGLMVLSVGLLPAVGVTGAYASFILSRARMQRVYRRMRGEPDWSGYYDNGRGFNPEPGRSASRRRRGGRR